MGERRETAPADVRFCLRCGGDMRTEEVAGHPRRACPRCGHVHFTDPKVGVGVAVWHDGGLLLVRRVMEPGRGRWALPGGFLDAGEDPRAAAARETLEEAGVQVRVHHVDDVYRSASGIFLLFHGEYVAGHPVAGDDADGAGFFGLDELPELAFESTRTVVARWRRTV